MTAARMIVPAAALAGALVLALVPSPARAWWHGGVFIGVGPVVAFPPPVYYPPPIYYPPPAYAPPVDYAEPPPAYAPPPAPYAPPPPRRLTPAPGQTQAYNGPYGGTCYAGVYVCPLVRPKPVGDGCVCPGIGAPSYGTVR